MSWFDNTSDVDLEYSVVTFLVHSKKQKEQYTDKTNNVSTIKVYGPLDSRT